MLSVKKEYQGKGTKGTFVLLDGREIFVDLDNATQEQLKLLKDNKHEFVTEKKDA